MVQNRAVDEAVFNVTEAIRNAADAAIPKNINSPSAVQPMVERFLPTTKGTRRAWGIFRRYPTTDNLIALNATKNRLERTPINFRCRQPLPYNCDFDMFELKRALSSAHNTSPGPDGISYGIASPFERGFTKSPLPIQPNMEGAGVSYSMARSHSDPHLRPGKDPKNPLSYRPIALDEKLPL
ncbi:putative RNA-directed DNA polymerase from transposon X-element [Trichonephila clavipes]|nr:putative RNA-directed DNA polymerase from transposon X-element [Trichonephila clavipes]